MMPYSKFSKKQIQERDNIQTELTCVLEDVNNAISDFNNTIEEAFEKVTEKLKEYNDVLEKVREWRDGIISDIDEHMSDKSEKWLESDRGQAYESWKAEFDDLSLDDIEIEKPEPIEEVGDNIDLSSINEEPLI